MISERPLGIVKITVEVYATYSDSCDLPGNASVDYLLHTEHKELVTWHCQRSENTLNVCYFDWLDEVERMNRMGGWCHNKIKEVFCLLNEACVSQSPRIGSCLDCHTGAFTCFFFVFLLFFSILCFPRYFTCGLHFFWNCSRCFCKQSNCLTHFDMCSLWSGENWSG